MLKRFLTIEWVLISAGILAAIIVVVSSLGGPTPERTFTIVQPAAR